MKTDDPHFVPSPERLRELVEIFTAGVNVSAKGDRQKLRERKNIRADLEQSAAMVANHVIMNTVHHEDPSSLLNADLDIKRNTTTSPGNSLVLPPTLSIKLGPVSGMSEGIKGFRSSRL